MLLVSKHRRCAQQQELGGFLLIKRNSSPPPRASYLPVPKAIITSILIIKVYYQLLANPTDLRKVGPHDRGPWPEGIGKASPGDGCLVRSKPMSPPTSTKMRKKFKNNSCFNSDKQRHGKESNSRKNVLHEIK